MQGKVVTGNGGYWIFLRNFPLNIWFLNDVAPSRSGIWAPITDRHHQNVAQIIATVYYIRINSHDVNHNLLFEPCQ